LPVEALVDKFTETPGREVAHAGDLITLFWSAIVLIPFGIKKLTILVASFAVCCIAQARAEDQQAKFPLKFRIARNADYFWGVVAEMDAKGTGLAVAPAAGPALRGFETNLTEGYYLGIVADKFTSNMIPQDGSLARVEVFDVLKENKVRFRVGPSAAGKIKKGHPIALLRPVGSSTSELRAAPDIVTLTEGQDPNTGSMKPSDQAKMHMSMNNLRMIALALHNYEGAHKRYPPWAYHNEDGKPTVSWRVLILPQLEEAELFKQFKLDEPWDSPHNKPLLDKMPTVFRDPIYGDAKSPYTNYAAIAGPGTVFPTDKPDSNGRRDRSALNGVSEGQIADGSSKTLFVGTVSPENKIPWTKPEDIIGDEQLPPFGKPGSFAAPFNTAKYSAGLFVFVDGHVQSIRSDIDMTEFHKLVTRNGAEPIDDQKIPELTPGNRPVEMAITITNTGGDPAATLEIRILPERGIGPR
jgi:hypothetical protein